MVISKTPLRISFFGGGTDFVDFSKKYGGATLSTSIDKYSHVFLRDLPVFCDYRNEILYKKIERVNSIDDIEHPICRETLKLFELNGLRIIYDSDMPARCGLGSSSAFSVGLVNAICSYKGEQIDKYKLAKTAINIERNLCKEAGGLQDQIASAFGGFNFVEYHGNDFEVQPMNISNERISELENNLMMFFTGITRFSSEVQKAVKIDNQEVINTLLQMKELTIYAKEILSSNDKSLSEFGDLLNETWKLKKKTSSKVSNDQIDQYYWHALDAGARGGKLLGAGGGGFLLFYVDNNKQNDVRQKLKDLQEVSLKFDNNGSQIIF